LSFRTDVANGTTRMVIVIGLILILLILLVVHTHIRGYYRKAVNRFGHATPVHIHATFASVDIKLKSI